MATSFEVVNASWHTVLSMKIKYNTVSSHWLHLYVPICKIFFSTFRNISSSETAHFLYKIVIICCFTTLEVLLLINSLWGENKSSQMLRADKQPPPLYVMISLTLPQTLTKKLSYRAKCFFNFLCVAVEPLKPSTMIYNCHRNNPVITFNVHTVVRMFYSLPSYSQVVSQFLLPIVGYCATTSYLLRNTKYSLKG